MTLKEVNLELFKESLEELFKENELVLETEEEKNEIAQYIGEITAIAESLEEYLIAELLAEGLEEDDIIVVFPFIMESTYSVINDEIYNELDAVIEEKLSMSDVMNRAADIRERLKKRLSDLKTRAVNLSQVARERAADRLEHIKQRLNQLHDIARIKGRRAKKYTKRLLAALKGQAITKDEKDIVYNYAKKRGAIEGKKEGFEHGVKTGITAAVLGSKKLRNTITHQNPDSLGGIKRKLGLA